LFFFFFLGGAFNSVQITSEAYSCGWKKAKAEGKSAAQRRSAGNARRNNLLAQFCKEGVKAALAFRDAR
jgi:hypothetical protein